MHNSPLPSEYPIDLSILGNGTLSVSSGSYARGVSLSIAANPADGFYFNRWEGDFISEDNPLQFDVDQPLTLKAIFAPIPPLSDEVLIYTPKGMDEHHVFMIENGGLSAYLVDKTGKRLKTWEFDSRLGNDLELFPDGSLIGMFKSENTSFGFGGYGGILKQFDANGQLQWEYELNTPNFLMHHDFTVLPSGNILALVWERIPAAMASAAGISRTSDLFTEKIIEINPSNNTIEWEWRSWDHKIQDKVPNVSNYGNVFEQFQKIDMNYTSNENGDIMHANGIEYNPQTDQIYISVNFYSEVWVIDHSLTTEEAKSDLGDLIYRFGNPSAYKGNGVRLFYKNHDPNLVTLDPTTLGHFMIFMNGSESEQSIVYDLVLPSNFLNSSQRFNPPVIAWSFTDPSLYHGRISGVQRLSNGNTLICEGDFGFWEVTPSNEVIWKYDGLGKVFWRGKSIPFLLP